MVVKRRSFIRARKAAGYSQESLAERLGVDRTTVARWESGEYAPQPWQRPRIAEAFGVSLCALGELLDGGGTTKHHVAEVSASLVQADGGLLAGCERVSAATQEHDRLSRVVELAGAYAEARALRATTSPSPVQDAAGGLVVPSGQDALAGLVASVWRGTRWWFGRAAAVPGIPEQSEPGSAYRMERSAS